MIKTLIYDQLSRNYQIMLKLTVKIMRQSYNLYIKSQEINFS